MPKKKLTPSEVLKKAIKDSEHSIYRIAKDAGIGYSSMHRFAHGERSVSLEAFDRLCRALGLELKQSDEK